MTHYLLKFFQYLYTKKSRLSCLDTLCLLSFQLSALGFPTPVAHLHSDTPQSAGIASQLTVDGQSVQLILYYTSVSCIWRYDKPDRKSLDSNTYSFLSVV